MTRTPDYPFGVSPELLEVALEAVVDRWGTDAYEYGDPQTFGPAAEAVRWGWLTRQTATPDVAMQMERIYFQTDVRGAMMAITTPVLLPAREADQASLSYLASLLRQPVIRLFPGEDSLKVQESLRCSTPSGSSSGSSRPRRIWTPSCRRCCSPTSSGPRSGRPRWATAVEDLIERHHAIVREALGRWRGLESDTGRGRLLRDLRTGWRARSAARSRSAVACATSGSRSARACTPASAS